MQIGEEKGVSAKFSRFWAAASLSTYRFTRRCRDGVALALDGVVP